ncbi:MAG TPA: LytTR family DNA-binding domain-containing protein [Cyclobacteriaceae bacterium]|nr:LytTR family DNA-binding domain-containing protein [Cyclobacteriaceae bacterium]
MAKLNCIIIEDEKPAQEVLKSFIAKTEWINLSGVFGDAVEALDFLKKHDVDLIFLDIQIPGITGLDFLKIVKNPPQIIITTAYSQYAIEAFELDVRDYLMKPFSFDRFLKAVNRITPAPDIAQVHQLQKVTTEKSFAFFNVNKVMVKVMFDDILYVESMREYVYIHLPENKVITKIGISEFEKLLTRNFLRVHRSFVVNTHKITAYTAEEIFINKVSIPIGTNYKKLVETFLLVGNS